MKRRDLKIYGQTDSNGNLLISNKQEMQEFFGERKNMFFVLSADVAKTKPLSIPLISYYKRKVVPDMREAFYKAGERYTLEKTDEVLREMSPITRNESYNVERRKWEFDLLEMEDLDNQQLVFFIEYLKELAAMDLECILKTLTQ